MRFKWLKWLLISVAVIVVGVGLLITYLGIFGGHVLLSASNPAGSITAEVIDDSGFAAATDAGYLGVTLKTRFNPIRHYVFGGSNYGARVQVSWISDHVLLIGCDNCEKLEGGNILERKWHRVTICYDRSNVIELPQEVDASCRKEAAPTVSGPQP
jgi:hypothetical protein